MTIFDLNIDRAVVAIPGIETYRRTSDGLWVTPLLGQVASIDGVTEALLGSDGSTAAQFPSRIAPSGPLRRGFYFDGGDQLNLGDSDRFSFTNGVNDLPFSVVCMISQSGGADRAVVNKTINTTFNVGEWVFYVRASRAIAFGLIDQDAGAYIMRASAANQVLDSVPVVVVGTYSGSGLVSGLKTYRDGVRNDASNISAGVYVRMRNTAHPVVVGNNTGAFLGSMIVPPIIYPYELSPVEVGVITARIQNLYSTTPVR